jgi:hypothetical protein
MAARKRFGIFLGSENDYREFLSITELNDTDLPAPLGILRRVPHPHPIADLKHRSPHDND